MSLAMESYSRTLVFVSFLVAFLVTFVPQQVHAKVPKFKAGPWKPARATFYGGSDGSGTFEGSCGYGELHKQGAGYGVQTTALSTALYKDAAACGACYEIKCDPTSSVPGVTGTPNAGCKTGGAASITVTATNLCPDGQWCGAPNEHFDLTQPAFLQIAEQKAGVVPVQYRRIPCPRAGGIKFTISTKSNPYFLLVLVWNVGGAGDVESVMIKGSEGKPFTPMKRNWGQHWESHEQYVGQSITFRIKTSDGKQSTSWHVVPANWQFGQTYESPKNYRA